MNRGPPRAGRSIAPNLPTRSQRLIARGVNVVLRMLALATRLQLHDPHGTILLVRERPVIFAAWHNRLALSPIVYEWLVRGRPGRRMAAMVSASRDGALLAAVLETFRVQPVRGSTSRRGPQALLELTSWARRGYDLAVTPDGPRGPRYVVQPGAVAAARVSGLPVIPISCNSRSKIQLRSWDRFQIPLPLTPLEVRLGPALQLDDSDQTMEQWRLELERRLTGLTVD
jgi:lysophospholipid acyltransferase (LPLAT)-like uncharacterized protein